MELAPSTLLGLCLSLSGILLYFIKIREKKLSRDYDLLFSSIGCLCGGILIFQGWRLDPILLLCQMMSGITAIFFIGETVWLRNIDMQKDKIDFNAHTNIVEQKEKIYTKTNYPLAKYSKNNKQGILPKLILIDLDYTFPIDFFEKI
jgi:hypothetical protein